MKSLAVTTRLVRDNLRTSFEEVFITSATQTSKRLTIFTPRVLTPIMATFIGPLTMTFSSREGIWVAEMTQRCCERKIAEDEERDAAACS